MGKRGDKRKWERGHGKKISLVFDMVNFRCQEDIHVELFRQEIGNVDLALKSEKNKDLKFSHYIMEDV